MSEVSRFLTFINQSVDDLRNKYPTELSLLQFNEDDYFSLQKIFKLNPVQTEQQFYAVMNRTNDTLYKTILHILDISRLEGTQLDKNLEIIFLGTPQYNSCKGGR